MRRLTTAISLLIAAACGPAETDLTYTMRTELRPSAPAGSTMPGNLDPGAALAAAVPDGGYDSTFVVSTLGTRMETSRTSLANPAGTVTISLKDGTTLVLNLTDKTYFKTPDAARQVGDAMKQLSPTLDIKSTGVFETIAGHRAERSTLALTFTLPAVMQSAGVKSVTSTGEIWLTNELTPYEKLAQGGMGDALNGFGLDKPIAGFALRTVLRGGVYGNHEIWTEVKTVSEVPTDPGKFAVPAGFREVPSPMPPMPAIPGTGRSGGND